MIIKNILRFLHISILKIVYIPKSYEKLVAASFPGKRKVVKNMGSGVRDPGFEFCLYHVLRVWLSASYLNYVPRFSHLKNGSMMVPSSKNYCKDEKR